MQSGQGEVQVAQLEGAVKQITKFAQGSRFKQVQVTNPHCNGPETSMIVLMTVLQLHLDMYATRATSIQK